LNSGKHSPYEQISDEELVEVYRDRLDLKVLGTLYKRYMYLVYGIGMKYLKNRDDSQDAVMQIFEVLVRDIPRFEIRNFKSWLYGVSRNYCLMQLRKVTGEMQKIREFSTGNSVETTRVMHPIDEEATEDLQDRLKACMEQLKEHQRLCVEMFYYGQKCYREIANELTLQENEVKSFIQNGKRNLKICLEKHILKNV
jgi:RNA polymerase sigma-70 factor (ECF subfamily)